RVAMRRLHLLLLAFTLAFGADDPWSRVQELERGVELRIFKKGSRQPVLAVLDRATERSVIIATKNRQLAISKDAIERIDQRPAQRGSRFEKESVARTKMSPGMEGAAGRPGSHAGVSTAT